MTCRECKNYKECNISCMQNAINVLNGLTKTVIPIGNVCPAPMPEFNSWTAPTAPTTGA